MGRDVRAEREVKDMVDGVSVGRGTRCGIR